MRNLLGPIARSSHIGTSEFSKRRKYSRKRLSLNFCPIFYQPFEEDGGDDMLASTILANRMRIARIPYWRPSSSCLRTCSPQPSGKFRRHETCSRSSHGLVVLQSSHSCAITEASRLTSMKFWTARMIWKRAAINTLRCLTGCTLGDFTTMWFLQSSYPQLGMGLIMLFSSKLLHCRITPWSLLD